MSLVEAYHAEHKARLARINVTARWRQQPPNKAEPFYPCMWFHHLVSQTDDTALIVRPTQIVDIQKAVCRKFKISRNDLISKRMTGYLILPRHIAMYLSKTMTLHSLPEIGRRFGGRDHTTVLYAVEKIDFLRRSDSDLARKINEIRLEFPAS